MRAHLGRLAGDDARFTFHDRVPHEELAAIVASHHVVVSPSRWESWSNVVRETLAWNRPVPVDARRRRAGGDPARPHGLAHRRRVHRRPSQGDRAAPDSPRRDRAADRGRDAARLPGGDARPRRHRAGDARPRRRDAARGTGGATRRRTSPRCCCGAAARASSSAASRRCGAASAGARRPGQHRGPAAPRGSAARSRTRRRRRGRAGHPALAGGLRRVREDVLLCSTAGQEVRPGFVAPRARRARSRTRDAVRGRAARRAGAAPAPNAACAVLGAGAGPGRCWSAAPTPRPCGDAPTATDAVGGARRRARRARTVGT